MWHVLKNLFGRNRSTCKPCSQSKAKPQRPALSFEQLEDRLVPTVTFQGGHLLTNVQAESVFFGPSWSTNSTLYNQASSINGFLKHIVNSSYMDMLQQAGYGVGRGTFTNGPIALAGLPAQINEAAIENELQALINANKLQSPDSPNSLYCIFLAPGVSAGPGFYAYHDAFLGKDAQGHMANIHFTVTPYPGGANPIVSGLSTFDSITEATSHELAEAVTDPEPTGIKGWFDNSYHQQGEIGDIVNLQWVHWDGYVVQKEAGKNDQALDPNGSALTVPAAPSFTATAVSGSQINLAWHAVAGATGYYVDEWINGAWQQVANQGSGSSTYTVSGLNPHTTYYFVVGASNAAGTAWANYQSVTTPAQATPPVAPSFTVMAISGSKVNLAWNAVSGATSYFIDMWINGAWKPIGNLGNGNSTCTVSGLNPHTIYYFVVGASNAAGTTWANYQSVTTLT